MGLHFDNQGRVDDMAGTAQLIQDGRQIFTYGISDPVVFISLGPARISEQRLLSFYPRARLAPQGFSCQFGDSDHSMSLRLLPGTGEDADWNTDICLGSVDVGYALPPGWQAWPDEAPAKRAKRPSQ